jgi:hypothetical protein
MAHLLKARNVEPEKQPMIANGSETTSVSRQQTTEKHPSVGSRFIIDSRC